MDSNLLEKLRKLVDAVIYAVTKKDAKDPIRRLEFIASHIKGDIDGYLSGKLTRDTVSAKPLRQGFASSAFYCDARLRQRPESSHTLPSRAAVRRTIRKQSGLFTAVGDLKGPEPVSFPSFRRMPETTFQNNR